MKRKVFYSFHYDQDSWRAATVRGIGVVEGNEPVSSNEWEAVQRGGDEAIKRWIAGQLDGRSCTVVLIGSQTANRPWVNHEIITSWNGNKGVVGIHIHNLLDRFRQTSQKGANPFASITLGQYSKLSSVAKLYDPAGYDSKGVYASITSNLSAWIEEAVSIRARQ